MFDQLPDLTTDVSRRSQRVCSKNKLCSPPVHCQSHHLWEVENLKTVGEFGKIISCIVFILIVWCLYVCFSAFFVLALTVSVTEDEAYSKLWNCFQCFRLDRQKSKFSFLIINMYSNECCKSNPGKWGAATCSDSRLYSRSVKWKWRMVSCWSDYRGTSYRPARRSQTARCSGLFRFWERRSLSRICENMHQKESNLF